MSRECNDSFDAFAKREGYKPGTWTYIRAARAWQEAWDAGRAALVNELEAERDSTPRGVDLPDGAKR